jgi:Flp pilus assembly secretin CpaC
MWVAFVLAILLGLVDSARAETIDEFAEMLRPSPATAAVHLEPAAEAEDLMRTLEIARGKSVFVRTGYDVKRVSVGNPELLDVVVLGTRELQFVAKATGSTNVLVWDTRGQPQASIDVQIGTPETYLERELQRILHNENLHVESARSTTILRGSVPSALALEQALMVARAFVAGDENAQVVNLLEVGGNQQIMLKVVIAEMSRTLRREFGMNFNALIDAGSGQISLAGLLGGLTSLEARWQGSWAGSPGRPASPTRSSSRTPSTWRPASPTTGPSRCSESSSTSSTSEASPRSSPSPCSWRAAASPQASSWAAKYPSR